MKPSPLTILFGGELLEAKLVDGSRAKVFVRALPQEFLGDVMAVGEKQHLVVELCSYLRLDARTKELPAAAAEHIPAPDGLRGVPPGWAQNLADESFAAIYDLASKLNFPRVVIWARRQIAAKKLFGPVQQAAIEQVLPLVEAMVAPLLRRLNLPSGSSPSTPSAPPPPASPEPSSSGNRSGGSSSSAPPAPA
jgi:hypothetical protein